MDDKDSVDDILWRINQALYTYTLKNMNYLVQSVWFGTHCPLNRVFAELNFWRLLFKWARSRAVGAATGTVLPNPHSGKALWFFLPLKEIVGKPRRMAKKPLTESPPSLSRGRQIRGITRNIWSRNRFQLWWASVELKELLLNTVAVRLGQHLLTRRRWWQITLPLNNDSGKLL